METNRSRGCLDQRVVFTAGSGKGNVEILNVSVGTSAATSTPPQPPQRISFWGGGGLFCMLIDWMIYDPFFHVPTVFRFLFLLEKCVNV